VVPLFAGQSDIPAQQCISDITKGRVIVFILEKERDYTAGSVNWFCPG